MFRLNKFDEIVKLIELIKERPGIYDYTSSDHSNRLNLECLWNEVSEAMQANSNLCKRKWASLRNAFARDLRLERDAIRYQRRKKKWYLADNLTFLLEHLNYRGKGSINESINEDYDCTMDESTFFDLPTQEVANEYLSTEAEDEENDPSVSVPAILPAVDTIKQNEREVKPLFFKRSRSMDDLALDERNMTFFRSLLPDILALSDKRQRMYKQHVLMKLNRFLDEEEIQT